MDYYDQISEGYEDLHKEEQLKKIAAIKEFISVDKEDKLLDVGCGTGISTEQWDCKKAGIDPSEKLIRIARSKKTGTEYKVAKAENIPYPDDFFDIVISITAIQNFDDIEEGLGEIKRVGKSRFALSFLKKSPKKEMITKSIKKLFKINKIIEEDKDIIIIASKQ